MSDENRFLAIFGASGSSGGGGGGGVNIYNADGTILTGRVATLTDTLSFNNGTLVSFNQNVDINANWRPDKGVLNINTNNQSFVGLGLTDTANGYYGGFFWRPTTNYLTIGSNSDGIALEPTANNQAYVFKSNQFEFTKGGTIQGQTAIKGLNTLSTASALQIYDGDSTPNLLWDFRNNGDVIANQDIKFKIPSNNFNFTFLRPRGVNANGLVINMSLLNSSNNEISYTRLIGFIVSNTNGSEFGKLVVEVKKSGVDTSIVQFDSVDGLSILANTTTNLLKAGDVLTVSTTDTTIKGGFLPLNLYRASQGVNFAVGLNFNLNNSSSVKTSYADIYSQIVTNTAGSENSNLTFRIVDSGTLTTKIKINTNSIEFEESLDMKNNRITNAVVNPTVEESLGGGGGTFTINSDQKTDAVIENINASTTIGAPSGTPVQSQSLVFRFKDNGTARAITWNAIFRAIGITLPTTTTANKLLYVGCKYNSTDTKWDVVSVQEEA